MDGKVLLKHPEDKKGVRIDKRKYDAIRDALLVSLSAHGGVMSHTALDKEVNEKLRGRLSGSISWYFEGVKLDLEARGLLERVPNTRPQLIRLLKK